MAGRYPHRNSQRVELRIDAEIVSMIDSIADYMAITKPVKRRAMYSRNATTEALLLTLLTQRQGDVYTPRTLVSIMPELVPALEHIEGRRRQRGTIVDK